MAKSDRLNLMVSRTKFLMNATKIAVHSREDWDVLSKYCAENLPYQLEAAIENASRVEDLFGKTGAVQSDAKRELNRVRGELKLVYGQFRRSVQFLCADRESTPHLLKMYPSQPRISDLSMGVMTFQKSLEQLESTPPFFDRNLFKTVPDICEVYNHLTAKVTNERNNRPSQRDDRDRLFVEVRSLSGLIKKNARFAFAGNPVMLERYR